MVSLVLWYRLGRTLMKASKKAATQSAQTDGPSFEQAIQRLEKIVADMESADLPLEDVLKKYEEGTRLVRFCSHKLEEAEKKIEILTKKADGTVTLKSFGPQDAEETEPPSPKGGQRRANEDEKEAKLF